MNPEEGDLRPQIIDRFGLCVDVEALMDPDDRIEVIKRAVEFQEDPESFHRKFMKNRRRSEQRL